MAYFRGKILLRVVYALLLLNGVLFFILVGYRNNWHIRPSTTLSRQQNYPEIAELGRGQHDFKELSSYFSNLAKKKGGRYAYEVLRAAPIPPDIDMHLLGHVVGDVLYRQEGVKGMYTCTQDFRNACSHSIVVGLFIDKGEAALPQIVETCLTAPGGSGAYTMCFHGLGHGILAYTGYEMEKTISYCKKTGTPEHQNREYVECVGGAVMEIIGGGFHNRSLWEKQSKKYLSKENPLSPCNTSLISSEARGQCYVYITPHLFQLAGADLKHPTAENFEMAFPFCDRIPASEPDNRDACFGGFGKEFVVLAGSRDIRQERIQNLNGEELKQVNTWCLLAKDAEAIRSCILYAVRSLYWGGENDRAVAIKFCATNNEPYRTFCYKDLIGAVSFFMSDTAYRIAFCTELPSEFLMDCKKQLNIMNL